MSKNTSRKTLIRIVILIAQCVAFILFYFISFLGNPLFFLILVIGSVVVLSTGTIYTVIHHEGTEDKITRKKPYISKIKALEKRRMLLKQEETSNFIEVYMNEMPFIQKYVESDKSYEDMPIIEDFIFTELSPKELALINRLGLTDIDKKQFIRELLYFTSEERRNLIDSMIKYQFKNDEELIYVPQISVAKELKSIIVYVISLIEPGEKRKIINIESTEYIKDIKDQLADMFSYDVEDFLLSTGGIIMNEDTLIKEYNIEDKDEIVLIPSRIPKK